MRSRGSRSRRTIQLLREPGEGEEPSLIPVSGLPWDVRPRLEALHRSLRREIAGIDRVAAALYDPKTDALKTFVRSTEGESPLVHHDARMAEVPSLGELARERRPRVIDDLAVFAGSVHEHRRGLLGLGFRSSDTLPFSDNGALAGFLFAPLHGNGKVAIPTGSS